MLTALGDPFGGVGQWQGAGQCCGGQPSHHLLPGGLLTLTIGTSGASSLASLTLSSSPAPLGFQKLTLGRGKGAVTGNRQFAHTTLIPRVSGIPQGEKGLRELTRGQFLLRQG